MHGGQKLHCFDFSSYSERDQSLTKIVLVSHPFTCTILAIYEIKLFCGQGEKIKKKINFI